MYRSPGQLALVLAMGARCTLCAGFWGEAIKKVRVKPTFCRSRVSVIDESNHRTTKSFGANTFHGHAPGRARPVAAVPSVAVVIEDA